MHSLCLLRILLKRYCNSGYGYSDLKWYSACPSIRAKPGPKSRAYSDANWDEAASLINLKKAKWRQASSLNSSQDAVWRLECFQGDRLFRKGQKYMSESGLCGALLKGVFFSLEYKGSGENYTIQWYQGCQPSCLLLRPTSSFSLVMFLPCIWSLPCQDLHREIELLPVHLREEAFLRLFLTTLGHWRNAGRVLLPLNLQKIHFQDLPSFLYASKRCSSTGSY